MFRIVEAGGMLVRDQLTMGGAVYSGRHGARGSSRKLATTYIMTLPCAKLPRSQVLDSLCARPFWMVASVVGDECVYEKGREQKGWRLSGIGCGGWCHGRRCRQYEIV